MKITILLILIIVVAGCSPRPVTREVAMSVPPAPLPDFDAMWDYNDPAATEARFREVLPHAEASGDVSYHAQLLTQIARTQGLQMKFEEAHETLDQVQAMLAEDLVVARMRYLLERGRVYNSSKDPDAAKPLFLEAWEVGLNAREDDYALDAAHMMAIVEPPELQLVWSERAMALAEKTTDERAKRWLGPLYNNTGWTYHDMGQYDKALELFEKSLAFRQERRDAEGTRIARWTVARTYRSVGRVEEALEMQKELEQEFETEGIQQDGYVYEEIGECLLLLGKTDEAPGYFRKAHELLSQDQWLVTNEADRLKRLKELGEGAAQPE
jgi:tetratricopeptide (TPR) repeat protein